MAFYLGLGFVLGGIVAIVVGPPGGSAWAFPVGISVAAIAGVLVYIGRTTRGMLAAPPELIERARTEGRMALARVDTLTQTGTFINEQPLCEIELTVQPVTGAAFRTEIRRLVQLTEIPRFQPGTLHVAAVLLEGQPDIALTDDNAAAKIWADTVIPEVAAAGAIRTPKPGMLRADGSRRTAIIGTGRRGRGLRFLSYLLITTLGAAAVIFPFRAGLIETLDAIPTGSLRADYRAPEPLERALAAVAHETGHTNVVSLSISDDLVSIDAPVQAGELNTDHWYYRRGVVSHEGPTLIQPDVAGEQFSTSEVDWRAVADALDTAIASVAHGTRDGVYLNVSRTIAHDPDDPWSHDSTGPVTISFAVSDGYRDHWFAVQADGSGLVNTDS